MGVGRGHAFQEHDAGSVRAGNFGVGQDDAFARALDEVTTLGARRADSAVHADIFEGQITGSYFWNLSQRLEPLFDF